MSHESDDLKEIFSKINWIGNNEKRPLGIRNRSGSGLKEIIGDCPCCHAIVEIKQNPHFCGHCSQPLIWR